MSRKKVNWTNIVTSINYVEDKKEKSVLKRAPKRKGRRWHQETRRLWCLIRLNNLKSWLLAMSKGVIDESASHLGLHTGSMLVNTFYNTNLKYFPIFQSFFPILITETTGKNILKTKVCFCRDVYNDKEVSLWMILWGSWNRNIPLKLLSLSIPKEIKGYTSIFRI